VLVAQDLAWYGRDLDGDDTLSALLRDLDALRADGLTRVRLLYLYPSEVRDPLVATMLELESVVPYFDLSLQHADPALLRRMKRWGSGERFAGLIEGIRAQQPDAVFRSSFISGFPGETEAQHQTLLDFLDVAQLDWAGFFAYSREDGTAAADLDGVVDPSVGRERLRELAEVQEPITAAARAALVGSTIEVLVDGVDDDGVAVGRSHREAPEIDGVVRIVRDAESEPYVVRPGALVMVEVVDVEGPDLDAVPVRAARAVRS
jgi:tRNA A37 methylthiotransferase MiaB